MITTTKRLTLIIVTLVMLIAWPIATESVVGAASAVSQAQAQQKPPSRQEQVTQILRVAASKKNAPYKAGATGPSRFDCSGYTSYVFSRAGIKLPRTSADQSRRAKPIAAKNARPGDLVFFYNGTRVYHVGIYAGSQKIWHAPRPGATVRLEKIWTTKARFGRI